MNTTDKVYHGTNDTHTFYVYAKHTQFADKWNTHLSANAYCSNHFHCQTNQYICRGHTNIEALQNAQKEWKSKGWSDDCPGLEAFKAQKIKTQQLRNQQLAVAIAKPHIAKPHIFGDFDTTNSRTHPMGVGSKFDGKWKQQGQSPTLQIGVIGSHPITICIHQGYNSTRDIGVVDEYEYTTPNKHIIIQRTLAFGCYKVSAKHINDENMKYLHLITTVINHSAIKQGIIL